MEKNCPFLPWIVQGALKFFEIAHHPETALRIGMIEWTGGGGYQRLNRWRDARGQIEQGLGGLGWQMIGQLQHRGFRDLAHIGQPFDRHAVAQ
jgi:hypothetical protein